jgi:putative FmdB family regulatory protein
MPLYEYKCHTCGKTFEVIQKFADEPLTIHPGCGGEVEKLFSAPAFHLKGTGWYATDYAKKGASGSEHKPDSKPAGTNGGETSPATSSSDTSSSSPAGSESKPAASEAKPAPSSAPAASPDK